MNESASTIITPAVVSVTAEHMPEAALQGRLGAIDIALATLAYAGPLGGVVGYTALIIGAGNGLGAPLAFLVVMAILGFFAVGYGALTKHVPYPGAFYAYITAGLGRAVGLGSSFMILGSYVAIGIGAYAFSGVVSKQFVEGLGGPVIDWWIYSLLFWVTVASLAYFHVALSAKVLGVLLIAELVAIFWFDGAVFVQGGAEGISLAPFTWTAFTSGNLGIALIFALALFVGFEATAIYREETRDPDRTIPKATMGVVIFIGLFYAVSSWALITGIGTSRAVAVSEADPAGAFFPIARQFSGVVYYHITSALILSSMFAANLAVHNVTTRYIYSLAVDGIFPKALGIAHPRHHSPHRASLTVSSVYLATTAALVLIGLTSEEIYSRFTGIAAFGINCAMTITSLATVVFFARAKAEISVWQAFIAPGISLVGLLIMAYLSLVNLPALVGGSESAATAMTLTGLALFAAGWVLAQWLRTNRPLVYAKIGRQTG